MKKIIALVLVLSVIFTLCACSAKTEPETKAPAEAAAESSAPAETKQEAPAEKTKIKVMIWGTIDGRDELEIPVKAKLDGEYTAALNTAKFKGFVMDVRCFFGTILSVLKHDGVVEGGTGELKKQEEQTEKELIMK